MATFTPHTEPTAAADADLALLRRYTGDLTEPYRQSDAELSALIADGPTCPQTWDKHLAQWTPDVPRPDLYEVAARVWDLRALEADAAGDGAEEVRVKSDRNGDVAVNYAGKGKLLGTGSVTSQHMRAMARRLRKLSCNGGVAQTVVVRADGIRELPVRGDLYPSQLVN